MVFWKILSFQILFSCKKEQLGWRQSILSHSLQRSHGNKPCYLDDMAAAKPLLRFSEHCWAEEDFEEECGKGEGSFESTNHPAGLSHTGCERPGQEKPFSFSI